MNSFLLFVFLVASLTVEFVRCQDANEFCSTCLGRRNTRDHYAHPTDCHKFYQCFFNADGSATGIERTCAPGTFFYERFLTCTPEGPAKCQDACLNETIQANGCTGVAGSCSQYIWCSTSSEFMCCPPNTRFNVETCGCDDDATCTDSCSQLSPAVPTSVAPPAFVNSTHCVDSYGNLLGAVADNAKVFNVIDTANDNAVIQRPCATGSTFSLAECTCAGSVEVNHDTQPSNKLCSVYLPFDTDSADHSSKKSATFIYGDASLSTEFSANGGGSMFFNGGRVEIPATKSVDLQNHGSFCLFYRCPNATCPTGGLLSNNNNDQKTSFSVILESQANNNFRALFHTLYPIGESEATANVNANDGFNQVCVVFQTPWTGTGTIQVYVNNQLASTATISNNWIFPAGCPFTVGTDQLFGNFNGYIDEVLICRRAITADEVSAHFHGQEDMRNAKLIP